jgi:hypothetical protein
VNREERWNDIINLVVSLYATELREGKKKKRHKMWRYSQEDAPPWWYLRLFYVHGCYDGVTRKVSICVD